MWVVDHAKSLQKNRTNGLVVLSKGILHLYTASFSNLKKYMRPWASALAAAILKN